MTYRYKGGGFVPGVPARDLTDDEALEFEVTGSPVYELVEDGASDTGETERTGSRRRRNQAE